ncbi:hypothetical protein C8R46DRAFT_1030629 [Mycena filopes]|nr:hypothetical protein C8R46DRAFT_1030629 [Mycena filopes]
MVPSNCGPGSAKFGANRVVDEILQFVDLRLQVLEASAGTASKSILANVAMLEGMGRVAKEWERRDEATFEETKTDVLHAASGRRDFSSCGIRLVVLDQHLDGKAHIAARAVSAARTLNASIAVMHSTWGMKPTVIRELIRTMVIPCANYGVTSFLPLPQPAFKPLDKPNKSAAKCSRSYNPPDVERNALHNTAVRVGEGQVCNGEMEGLVRATESALEGGGLQYNKLVHTAQQNYPHLSILNLWMPAHIGTMGNKWADEVVKAGTELDPDPELGRVEYKVEEVNNRQTPSYHRPFTPIPRPPTPHRQQLPSSERTRATSTRTAPRAKPAPTICWSAHGGNPSASRSMSCAGKWAILAAPSTSHPPQATGTTGRVCGSF